MIDFPIGELLDDRMGTIGLEHHLHPRGLVCPHCGRSERRVCRAQGPFPAYRCRACEGDDTRLPRTGFEQTRQRPATLVLLRRGIAKGEPTARLARALGRSRKQLPTLRQRIQGHLHETAPTEGRRGTAFDERYHHAGEKTHPSP